MPKELNIKQRNYWHIDKGFWLNTENVNRYQMFLDAYCKPWPQLIKKLLEEVLEIGNIKRQQDYKEWEQFWLWLSRCRQTPSHYLVQQDVRSGQGQPKKLCRKHPVLTCGTLLQLWYCSVSTQKFNLCLSVSDSTTACQVIFWPLNKLRREEHSYYTGFLVLEGAHALRLKRLFTFTVG